MLDRDGNDETCLDIARRLGRDSIAEFLTQNYSQLEDKVGSIRKRWIAPGLQCTLIKCILLFIDRVVLPRTLAQLLQVMALQRGIVHCITT